MWKWLKDRFQIARGLSPSDRLALAEAWFTLLWFYVAIRLISFERLNHPVRIGAKRPEALTMARDLHHLVHLASRLHLLSMTCLPRTLTLWWMLVRRSVPAVIQIGVGGTVGRIQAHAWLEVEGQQVGEVETVTERFQRFDLGGGNR